MLRIKVELSILPFQVVDYAILKQLRHDWSVGPSMFTVDTRLEKIKVKIV